MQGTASRICALDFALPPKATNDSGILVCMFTRHGPMLDCDWYDKDGRQHWHFPAYAVSAGGVKGLTEITYFMSLVCWGLTPDLKDRPLIGRSLDVVWDLVIDDLSTKFQRKVGGPGSPCG